MIKKKELMHLFLRIVLLVLLIPIASIIGLSTLDKNRRCGTGDGLAVFFYIFILYCIWVLGLLYEAYFLNKKKENRKRNLNFIMAFTIPTLFFLLYLYFQIIELFN
ncbi:putative membrane protein [Flavobacterium sp. 7E]|nr:hypothetical protein [Flavobacterium sp. PL002]NRS89455.1 putative membrane protein [Flavobacterium sp. 7E]NRT15191.1 putative membrane protein [Flavobacterium sp. 28A]